jgi:hypothetical protein
MKQTGIKLRGFKLAKDGRTVVRDEKAYDVSTQLKRRYGSKRTRVARPGEIQK